MNEPEKSDKPVVPMKPANSGASVNFWEFIEQLEQVEGRGLAKENEEQAGNETGVVFQAGPAKQADRTQGRLEESDTLDEGLHSTGSGTAGSLPGQRFEVHFALAPCLQH